MINKINFYRANIKNLFSIKKLFYSTLYHLYFFKLTRKKFKGLHLGSGNIRINDFLNIDANIFFNCDVIANIKKLKVSDNSVENIYNAHILEHINRRKLQSVLREWKRVLEPGGTIYICVPDLEMLFNLYLENLSRYENDKESKKLTDFIVRIIYGGQDHKYNYHYNGFSFLTLKNILELAGFKNVERIKDNVFDLKDGSTAAFGEKSISLNIKATK